jgi:hypothetical protein
VDTGIRIIWEFFFIFLNQVGLILVI